MRDRRTTYRGQVVGWGPFRADWYSLCSGHGAYAREECPRCMAGYYVNRIVHRIGHYFYEHHYRLWYWWVNRPNSRVRRDLERWFPKLRRDA